MSAGLPGFGLGGFFFVLSALAAPLLELPRLLSGRSSTATWREIGRNVAISLLIVAMVDFALRMLYLCAWLLGSGSADRLTDATVLPLAPMSITLLLLATVLAVAKLAQLGFGYADRLASRQSRQRRRLTHGPSCSCCSE